MHMVIQLLGYLRRQYHIASLQLSPQHSTSPFFKDSVDFMDELISASARCTNGEFFDLTNDKLTRAYRRTVAMKLFAKHLADRRQEMLQSLQQFVDANEAAIGCLNNDYSDNTMQRLVQYQQSQSYFEAWGAPFHFLQQATRNRTYMLSLTLAAIPEQLSVNVLATHQHQPWVWISSGISQPPIISTATSRAVKCLRLSENAEGTPAASESPLTGRGDDI
jgi:hypothetical protein